MLKKMSSGDEACLISRATMMPESSFAHMTTGVFQNIFFPYFSLTLVH